MNITPKEEIDELGFTTFEEVREMSVKGTSNILRDFTVVKEHKPFQLSGITFYEYEAHYVFEHADLTYPLKVELTSLKALHNGFYLL